MRIISECPIYETFYSSILYRCFLSFVNSLLIFIHLHLTLTGLWESECFPPQWNSQVHQTLLTQWASLGSGCHIFAKMFWPKKCCQPYCLGFASVFCIVLFFELGNFNILTFSLSVAYETDNVGLCAETYSHTSSLSLIDKWAWCFWDVVSTWTFKGAAQLMAILTTGTVHSAFIELGKDC